MSNSCDGLDTCNISPVQCKGKHTTTPMRTRRKTSRQEQCTDVHTTCSTPTAHRSPRLQRPTRNSPRLSHFDCGSPSSSFPCSQSQDHPDVVWDFTSPKLPKGSKKKEFKITIQELLDNLNSQTPDCSKSAPYVTLLENWMANQPVETTVKKQNKKKEHKNKSRHRIEELTKFINSIQKLKEKDTASNEKLQEGKEGTSEERTLESNNHLKNSFIDGGSTDDSSEELWGDTDNSFLIKATQELEKVAVITTASCLPGGLVSTIPATLPNTSESHLIKASDKSTCDQHNDLMNQLTDVDWDDDDDEWDKGFLIEDDDLSLVPDELLSGECVTKSEEKENIPLSIRAQSSSVLLPKSKNLTVGLETVKNIVSTLNVTELSVPVQSNAPSAELFNSFEDDSFEDESLFCQPEILSQIDEVESMASQPKCTPEEIRKKKDEAIQRRKQLKRKT